MEIWMNCDETPIKIVQFVAKFNRVLFTLLFIKMIGKYFLPKFSLFGQNL